MIKAVIFDIGGVLHASKIKYVEDDIKKTLKLNSVLFKRIYLPLIKKAQTGEITEKEFWELFIKATKTKEKLPKESLFLREYIKRFMSHKKVLQIAKKLKSKGYKIALLSNTIPSHTQYKKTLGMYDDFDVKILSYQVGLMKPDSKIYKLTLKKLKTKPYETIFIDDKKENVVVANKLGIHGILFKNAYKLQQDLKKLDVL